MSDVCYFGADDKLVWVEITVVPRAVRMRDRIMATDAWRLNEYDVDWGRLASDQKFAIWWLRGLIRVAWPCAMVHVAVQDKSTCVELYTVYAQVNVWDKPGQWVAIDQYTDAVEALLIALEAT